MHKKIHGSILSIILTAGCLAQTVHPRIQTADISLGAYSKHFRDAFSFICNQAALSSLKGISAAIHGESIFALRELNAYSFAASFPAAAGGIGFQAHYFGFADYNESNLGLAYGKSLGKLVDMGIQFDYNLFHIAGYGNTEAINFEMGLILHPAEGIDIGLHVYNPVGGALGKNTGEKLASVYRTGIGYEVSGQVLLAMEMIKEEGQPAHLNAGMRYVFAKQFFAAIGIVTSSPSPYGEVGLRWKNLRLDWSAAYHPQLGFTPGLSLQFGFEDMNNLPDP